MAAKARGRTREALQADCGVPPVERHQRLQVYFNAAMQLMVQGEAYYQERDLKNAYVYLKRFSTLALHGIPSHTAFNTKVYAKDKGWLVRERGRILELLEEVCRQLDAADEALSRRGQNAAGSPSAPPAWLDDLPEAPTGPVMFGDRKRPPVEGSGPPPSAEPSAPPAPFASGEWECGDGGVDTSQGTTTGARGNSSGSKALTLGEAFEALSMYPGTPGVGQYPEVGRPQYQRERPSMRERGTSLKVKRKVRLPSTLVAYFEEVARPNTRKPPYGIETCGILAGRVVHNELEMTTLIIPKQEGTSDSVATTDETQLFNYMLANKLITLGWIHTHPVQDCFMSSVDVHTHCGYQLMLPEAVAVVFAPRDRSKSIGVFRLTEPAGMKLIQECKLKGFHVHPEGVKIYEEVPLEWSSRLSVKLVDLR